MIIDNHRRKFFRHSLAAGALLSASACRRSPSQIVTTVLIIGSGPAGLSMADKLTAAGVDVLVVESGIDNPAEYYQELNQVTGAREPAPYGLGQTGQRAVGGTTHVWGGITPRLRESDFSTLSDYGYGLDWPISFSEMSRYYCEAGAWLGNTDSLCDRRINSPFIASSKLLINELQQLGISDCIAGSMSVTSDGQFNPANLAHAVVPDLLKRKNMTLLKGTTVRRLEINAHGEVTGALCVDDDSTEHLISADKIVLAGGVIQNARLLLLSRNKHVAKGIGNDYGNVGAYFMDHPNMQFWLKPKKELILPQYGNTYINSYHYYERMKESGMGSALMRFAVFNPLWLNKEGFQFPPESFGVASLRHRLMIGVLCEQEPIRENRISLDTRRVDRFGDPLAHLQFAQSQRDIKTINYISERLKELANIFGRDHRIRPLRLSTHHLMGTTRMSASYRTGVVDKNQKVFGTDNLYIAGASVFPTGGAANPTLSLTALSLRLADHILSSAN